MSVLSVDFETRSAVDLTKAGVYRYAEDPTTDILCMAFAFDDEDDVHVWARDAYIAAGAVQRVFDHVRNGGEMRAHNAQFERILWREVLGPRCGFPIPTLEQWHCTAAEAAAMALPRSLEMAATALNLPVKKDAEGRRLMLQMCKPRRVEEDGTLVWWEDDDRIQRLIEYCKQDVRTERAIAKRLRRLSPKEREVYLLDQRINDRGIMLDVPLVEAAQRVVDEGMVEANRAIKKVTGGAVMGITKVADLTRWLQEQGVDADDVRKSTVRDLLADPDDLDLAVQEALKLRQEAGKSSTSKLKSMQAARCTDDRVRGLLLYHGASTGRWSGKLIQPQNFPRGTVKDVEDYIPLILEGQDAQAWADPPLAVVSSLLRSMLVASPGNVLMAGDYSQVEARILGWFAGEPYGDREYERMAAAIFRVPLDDVTPEQRHVGKGTVLGCGYQMGWSKFQVQMAEQTGVWLEDEVAERAVRTYRTMKAGIPSLWRQTEAAAIRAVDTPGHVAAAGVQGNIRYVVRGQFLWCILPSGRPLAYALPQVNEVETEWGTKRQLSFMGINTYTRKWQRNGTYGGHLVENVVQATARDVMAEAMLRLEAADYPVVLTVHDEVVSEVPEGCSLDDFLALLRKSPQWASDLTLEVEGWSGERYRK
jgi:DNA polymerase bacteriophage-type